MINCGLDYVAGFVRYMTNQLPPTFYDLNYLIIKVSELKAVKQLEFIFIVKVMKNSFVMNSGF